MDGDKPMPKATPSWEPRYTVEPTPQNHEIRQSWEREIPLMDGALLRARRASLGLSDSQAAVILDVSKRTVTRWETAALEIPERHCEVMHAVAEAGAHYYELIADHRSAVIRSYGWRTLPEWGLCLPESWWLAVVGLVPGVEVRWAEGHPMTPTKTKRAKAEEEVAAPRNGKTPPSTQIPSASLDSETESAP